MGDKILDSDVQVWNVGNIQVGRIWAANTAYAMAQTVETVAEGATYDLVLTTSGNHGYSVGSHLRLTGTTNHNGAYIVLSAPTTATIEVNGIYDGTGETGLSAVLTPAVAPGMPFRIIETRLHCSGACTTENFTITLDSGFVATLLDVVLFSQAMASVVDIAEDWSQSLRLFTADDAVVFGFANGNGINWGLEVIYQFLSS